MVSTDLTQTASGVPSKDSNVPLATAGLLIGMLLSVLDQTVVAIALPDIAAELGGMDSIGWVITIIVANGGGSHWVVWVGADLAASRLFRGHERRGAHHHTGEGVGGGVQCTGNRRPGRAAPA